MMIEWIERFARSLEARGFSPRTIADRREALRTFAREVEADGPEALTAPLLVEYARRRVERVNQWGRRDEPATRAAHLSAVRQFVRFLEAEDAAPAGMSRHVPRLRVPEKLPGTIPTDEQVRRILSSVDLSRRMGVRDRAILELLYATGLRPEDVDLDGGLVRVVRGKGGKERMVPLGREAAAWVRRYLLDVRPRYARGREGGALWVSMQGVGLSVPGLQKMVREQVTASGVGINVTSHALRRACATEMVRAGAPLWPVKELLGHARLDTLRRYARLTINDVREAHRKYHPRERR